MTWLPLVIAALFALPRVLAIELDVNNPDSIRNATSLLAANIFSYYNVTNATSKPQIGIFPLCQWCWWESGGIWGGMVDYASYTNDDKYLNETLAAMAAQMGPKYDYVMLEQYVVEANDDQVFWVFPALAALEQNLPALPCPANSNQSVPCPSTYLNLVTNAFEDFVTRWYNDSSSCGGGLRWQFRSFMAGYDYKNSVSNGGFFNVAARLARYTGNSTFADWAGKIFDWEQSIGLIGPKYHVFDGAHIEDNCTSVDQGQWSYNIALFLHGAAAMYNYTGSQEWATRTAGLLNATQTQFFSPFTNATGVMYEFECEERNACNEDELSFKAYLARSMGKTAVLAPFLKDQVHSLLVNSSMAAARSCAGGAAGTSCGARWYTGGYDGNTGLGQELSALETVQALLAQSAPPPAMQNHQPAGAGSSSRSGTGTSTSSSASSLTSNLAGTSMSTATPSTSMEPLKSSASSVAPSSSSDSSKSSNQAPNRGAGGGSCRRL